MSTDAGIEVAWACNFKSKPLAQDIGVQIDIELEAEQDMETIPTKTNWISSDTQERGKYKKKKKCGISSNKPKTSEAILKSDDPLLPAEAKERKHDITNC